MLITPYLDGFNVDPETKQVLSVALEMTRVSLGLADDFANGIIASGSLNLPRRASAIPIVCVKAQPINYAGICSETNRGVIQAPRLRRFANGPAGSFRRCIRRHSRDPRARHGDRGSGLAWGRKQSQPVIVGRISLEA